MSEGKPPPTPPEDLEPSSPTEEAAPAESPSADADDSVTFSRCAECANAEEVNTTAGTLVCKKHNMCVNAEADEIPDDCVEYEAKG